MEPITQPFNGPNLDGQSPLTAPNTGVHSGTDPITPNPATHSFLPADATPVLGNLSSFSRIGIGSVIDGYTILDLIGKGGMGVVYRALQAGSEQTVAVKMIHDSFFAGAEATERFDREFKALGRLQSVKNIAPIYHVGQCEEGRFLVMPFFTGGNLGRHLTRYRGDPRKAILLVEKLARAVHQLHRHKILHRDIKPGNVLLDADDEPYLADFGLVKLLDDEHSLTKTQERMGTPAYMAPEQTGLVPTPISVQTDVWALGVLLYETLTGARPFGSSKDEDSTSLFWKITRDAPPKPRKLQPNLDPALEAVILKCLEKDPTHRFASAEDLADELARWLRQEKVQTPPVTLSVKVRRLARKHPRLTLALALAAFVLAATAVVGLEHRRRHSLEYIHESSRAELADKGVVTLIPERGKPAVFQPVFGYRMMTGTDANGSWRIDSPENWGLVELLRDLPVESFKLRAEIRHLKSQPVDGRVGIFLAHQTYAVDKNTPHFWASLVYNDCITAKVPPALVNKMPPLKGNSAQLMWEVFANNGTDKPVTDRWQGPCVSFQPAGFTADRWRVLEMEWRPDQVRCFFDGKPLRPQERSALETGVQDAITERIAKDPKYLQLGDPANLRLEPRGSLGLVVCNGSIAVKNVTVTRLTDLNQGE